MLQVQKTSLRYNQLKANKMKKYLVISILSEMNILWVPSSSSVHLILKQFWDAHWYLSDEEWRIIVSVNGNHCAVTVFMMLCYITLYPPSSFISHNRYKAVQLKVQTSRRIITEFSLSNIIFSFTLRMIVTLCFVLIISLHDSQTYIRTDTQTYTTHFKGANDIYLSYNIYSSISVLF